MITLILKAFLFILFQPSKSVYICNGDFEQYGLIPDINGLAFNFFPSNYSCWYNSIGEVIEVNIIGFLTSSLAELAHNYKYILCQNVQLISGTHYQLNFSVYNQQ